jgi:hypothetical protein
MVSSLLFGLAQNDANEAVPRSPAALATMSKAFSDSKTRSD